MEIADTSKQAATSSAPAPPDKRRYDRSIVEGPLRPAVWKIAWPTMLTNIIGGFQGIVDHALVGHLVGYNANAAIGVAWQIFIVVIVFIASLFTGMSVLVARFANAAVHVAARFGLAGAALIGFFFLFFPQQLLAVFGMRELAVVEIGVQLLRVLSASGLFIAVALTYTGGLQGTGDTRSPLYISIVSQIIVPLGACFVIQQTSVLDPIDIWIAILAGHVTRCALSVIRFKQGKWRGIVVDIEPKAKESAS